MTKRFKFRRGFWLLTVSELNCCHSCIVPQMSTSNVHANTKETFFWIVGNTHAHTLNNVSKLPRPVLWDAGVFVMNFVIAIFWTHPCWCFNRRSEMKERHEEIRNKYGEFILLKHSHTLFVFHPHTNIRFPPMVLGYM